MKMQVFFTLGLCGLMLGFTGAASAQGISTEAWPPDTDFSQEVHYWSADGFLMDAIPDGQGDDFYDSITVNNGGDQSNEDVTIAGVAAKRATSQYMNFRDDFYFELPNWPQIDVLVQYFADAGSLNDDVGFLMGVLGHLHGVGGYQLTVQSDQFQWWVFRLDNTGDELGPWAGNDTVGTPGSGGDAGGVNNGTIRMERVNDLIVRAVAWGPAGVFGATETINVGPTGEEFDPDNYPIVAEWNPNEEIADGVDLYRDDTGDQEPIESEGIGPSDDQRQAVRPAFDDGSDDTQDIYLNWEILNEYFGPTSQPSTRVKIVVEYYDDPELVGAVFGPEAYVTAGDTIAFFDEAKRETLAGSGEWKEAVFWVPNVKFKGVNVDTQAAARFVFSQPVYISRYRVGVLRTSGIYENVDPIPDAYPFDPDPYQIYGELDIDQGVSNGIGLGDSTGDQEYIQEENVGPAGDQRTAIRPSLDLGTDPFDRFMNFAVLNEHFGPSDQPNAVVKLAADYWDNPALVGESFGPEVYKSDIFGIIDNKFVPTEQRVTIEGTDTWRTAVWLVPDVNFSGVNQGPQAGPRFWFSDDGAIHISRIRMGVIRPVGIHADEDPMEDLPVNTPVVDWMFYE